MTDGISKIRALEATLAAMLSENIDITAREVVRQSDGVFKHPSDITRQPDRRAVFEDFEARQKALRDLMCRADKTSKANLSTRIAALEEQVCEVTSQRDLLIASHRAMILAVGEVGGAKAWLRFFEGYERVLSRLRGMGALPSAEVTDLATAAASGRDRSVPRATRQTPAGARGEAR